MENIIETLVNNGFKPRDLDQVKEYVKDEVCVVFNNNLNGDPFFTYVPTHGNITTHITSIDKLKSLMAEDGVPLLLL